MEIFYADKQSETCIPERLLDWLADYDCLFSGTQPIVHAKLVDFQKELVTLQNTGSVPPAANSRLSPLPPEPVDFYNSTASVDIPLDSAADLKKKERESCRQRKLN